MGTSDGAQETSTPPLLRLTSTELEALLHGDTVQKTLSGDEWPAKLEGKTLVLTSPTSRVSRTVTARLSEGEVHALLCADTIQCMANGVTFRLVGPAEGLRSATPKAKLVSDAEMIAPDGASVFSFELF